jgi:hypothetical protein
MALVKSAIIPAVDDPRKAGKPTISRQKAPHTITIREYRSLHMTNDFHHLSFPYVDICLTSYVICKPEIKKFRQARMEDAGRHVD